jgi:hypothetical protein
VKIRYTRHSLLPHDDYVWYHVVGPDHEIPNATWTGVFRANQIEAITPEADMPLEVGQKVRVMRTALKGNVGTVIEVRELSGDDWYTVGGQVADHPDELWNAPFREHELEAV